MSGERSPAFLDTSYVVRYLVNDPPDMVSKPSVLEALQLCRNSARVSFADALIWAQALHMGAERIYTFDGRFPSRGIEIEGT